MSYLLWPLVILALPVVAATLYCLATLVFASSVSKRFPGTSPARALPGLAREIYLQTLIFVSTPYYMLKKAWSCEAGRRGVFVILIPGYSETDFIFLAIRRALLRAGFAHATFRSSKPFGDLLAQSRELGEFVERTSKAPGKARCVLLGHSMGGLLARRAILDGADAATITVATPHRGTKIASVALGACARQMKPGCDFLEKLNAEWGERRSLNLLTAHDNVVAPRSSAQWDSSDVIVTDGWCHNGVLFSSAARNAIIRHLDGLKAE